MIVMAEGAAVVGMNSGQEGKMSYANNSSFQKAIASATKQARQEMAAALYRSKGRPASMAIANLGCATGPNALLTVTDAVEAVLAECQQSNGSNSNAVELQVFLNDLPGNDFNAVFRLLPTSPLAATGRCLVSAWPGSFYGRIFPEASLDYVVSSSSLHFLSSPPPLYHDNHQLNRGRIYISSGSPEVVLDTYAAQFHADFSAFLRCRSPEMRPGGLLLATFVARRTSCPTAHDCYIWDLLADALMDMAAAGLVDEEQVHAFNAPYYSPSPDDLLRAIDNEGSFSVRTMRLFEITRRHLIITSSNKVDQQEMEEELLPRQLAIETACTIRAVVEPMMRNHFGWADMDALFSRYCLRLEAYYLDKDTRNKDDITNVFLVLEKKQHHNCY
ncbi:hypothetical protein PR202_gb23883 [Eleusine coracana subsp. coracana]|uniref:Uncharacterized protein n=1 Tax=Eleusine coracana subsp. coracana TaxID=191504 RepID=A0AAV5FHC0_ELECO|nr:hypothetical protein PR202_gb23883 [Eleusine coracana subsp. coracana]